ncbi:phage tail protein [Adlercreutzia sp. ZJ242]|uniref:phage tail protein n=1 Tax=Adlercreutzia sp. ZJ242 TaxID=2709409 RepID=UPI0013EE0E34|nr:phage tail protein [Adlercreutzia sp. ZJ242]
MTEKAHNTSMTYLMNSANGTTYTKLVDIKEFPDLGSAPPTLDTTTLSDMMHTYINDILDTGGGLEFTANYKLEDYKTLLEHAGKEENYAVWFGAKKEGEVFTPDGSFGKFEFKGELSVWKKGAGVGAVQDMGISIAPSTEIKLNQATGA